MIWEIIAKLDFFERIHAFMMSLTPRGRNSVVLQMPRSYISGADAELLLSTNGIRVWDRKFDRRNFYFRVTQEDVGYALELLNNQEVL